MSFKGDSHRYRWIGPEGQSFMFGLAADFDGRHDWLVVYTDHVRARQMCMLLLLPLDDVAYVDASLCSVFSTH